MTLTVKDPGARIDYEFDWGDDYLAGQVIAESGWTVVPVETGGLVVAAAGADLTTTVATLDGGVAGHVYRVTNQVTLSDGQIDERSLTVRVEER